MTLAISLSGGGIRGIIPIQALAEIEKQLGGLVRDHFDYVGGCSTGSALTALIAAGVPMEQALTFYTGKDADKVFSPQNTLTQDALRATRGWMFDPKHLHDALVDALGPVASKWTINDCPVKVLIIAMDTAGHPWFFCKDNGINGAMTGNCSLVDATVASCCAPTYFDFWPVQVGGVTYEMADGGTGDFADPIHRLAVEMFYYDNYAPEDTKIISLGTGVYAPPVNPPKPKGLLPTISWTVSTLVDMAENLAQQDARREYKNCQFETLNPAVPADFDESSLSARPELLKVGAAQAATLNWKDMLG